MTRTRLMEDCRREWRLALSDAALPWTIAIIGTLTLLALFAGWLRTTQRTEQQETRKRDNLLQQFFLESAFDESVPDAATGSHVSPAQKERRFELLVSARSPDLMRYTGGIWWSILPASPLSCLSMGATGEWPDHYYHRGSSTVQTLTRSVRPNPLLTVVGAFDLTLLVGAILPLAVIALTYNLVSADREQGRWPLVGLQAYSLPRLIVARCLVRVACLAITVTVLTACCTLMSETSQWDIAAVRNFLIWNAWLLAYLTFWTTLAIAVNSFPFTSTGAGLLHLLCWTLLVIAVPSAVELGINRRFRFSPPTELIAMEEDVRSQVEREGETVWADFVRQRSEITLDSDNPQQEYLLRDLALSVVTRSRVQARVERYHQRFLDRESAIDQTLVLSPVLAWRTAADECSGTTLRHHVEFAQQTAEFHDEYISYFERFSVAGRELSQTDIRGIPRFNAHQLQTRLHLAPLLMSAASLLFWTTPVALLGWWNFRRRAIQ